MKCRFARAELMAALIFTSRDEDRFMLNGVRIEMPAPKGRSTKRAADLKPLLVATDGRQLAVINSTVEQPEDARPGALVLAPTLAKALVWLTKWARPSKALPIDIELALPETPVEEGGRMTVRLVTSGIEDHAAATKAVLELMERDGCIPGNYPSWRSVLPPKNAQRQRVGVTDLGLNAALVGGFAKAANALGVDPVVQMNLVGTEEVVEFRLPRAPEFYGMIMPCKLEEDLPEYQPEFLQITGPVDEAFEKLQAELKAHAEAEAEADADSDPVDEAARGCSAGGG
jgi:hypothetical protein